MGSFQKNHSKFIVYMSDTNILNASLSKKHFFSFVKNFFRLFIELFITINSFHCHIYNYREV